MDSTQCRETCPRCGADAGVPMLGAMVMPYTVCVAGCGWEEPWPEQSEEPAEIAT